jgi:uncharacterized delta-60 repeat protein
MKKLVSFLVCLLFAVGVYAQSGSLDLTFNPGDLGFGHGDGPNDYVCAAVSQPDGKILIGGAFTTYNGVSRSMIARLNADGTLDHTFDPGTGFYHDYSSSPVYAIEVLANGKILVGGLFNLYNGQAVNNLIQLNTDGSLDENFNTGTGPNDPVEIIRIQNDGRILIGGMFTSYNGVDVLMIARLHPDGSLDNTFQPPDFAVFSKVLEIQLLEDGRILVGGTFTFAGGSENHYIVRLLDNGSVDPGFNINLMPVHTGWEFPFVRRIYITDQNKYLVAGRVAIPDQSAPLTIFQLNEDGSFDEEFQIPSMTSGSFESQSVYVLLPWDEDKYLIGGNFSSINGLPYQNIALINAEGTIDTSFNSGVIGSLYGAIEMDSENILIIPDVTSFSRLHLAKINRDFDIDFTFNPGTGANDHAMAVHTQSNGRILISGRLYKYNDILRRGIARLLPDGTLDTSFDPLNGFMPANHVISFAEQDDGKILAGGNFTEYNESMVNRLMRLNSDGSLDNTFNIGTGASNTVLDIKIQDADKIIVAGAFGSFNDQPAGRIVRLNHDGSIDDSFDTGYGANNSIMCIVRQPDGKIVIGGTFTMYDSIPRNSIARLNNDGSLDFDFDPGNGFQSYNIITNPRISALGLQEDSKIIVAGLFEMFNNIHISSIVRLNHNGSLDTTFISANLIRIETLLIQPDDKIIIGGYFPMFDSIPVGHFARLNANGSLDTTFHSGTGFNDFVEAMALQEDGNILVGGRFTGYDGAGRNRIARIIGAEPDGIPGISRQNNWVAFPNPSADFLTLKSDKYAVVNHIRLYDLHGRMVFEKLNFVGSQFTINAGNLAAGVYIVEIQETDKVSRLKIIKH